MWNFRIYVQIKVTFFLYVNFHFMEFNFLLLINPHMFKLLLIKKIFCGPYKQYCDYFNAPKHR